MFKIIIFSLFYSCLTFATVSNGPYAGIEIGGVNQTMVFNASSYNSNTTSTLSENNWSFLGRLNLGYNMDKYSGFELGFNYNALPGYTYPNNSGSFNGDVTTLDGSFLVSIPTTLTKLSVFGRIGAAYDWINGSSTNGMTPSGEDFADVLGAGIKYNISPKTSFRLEWIENGLLFPVGISSGSTNVANFSEQSFLLGVNYHF